MPRPRRAPAPDPPRPIITLMSDFGTRDSYVAVMKAVLLRHCPAARLIDVTHSIAPQDVLGGSITLERAIDGFPPGTIHLAVVDPGVGTKRRLLVVRINDQLVVCPDNGLITWAWRRLGGGKAYELTWKPKQSSATFHGRDFLAPAAGMLACGVNVKSISRPIEDPVLLDVAPAKPGQAVGAIIHIDHFGNATTNVGEDVLKAVKIKSIRVRGRKLGALRRTYWDAAPGEPIALIGSAGLLEIAVRDGSAAKELHLQVGDEVRLKPKPPNSRLN